LLLFLVFFKPFSFFTYKKLNSYFFFFSFHFFFLDFYFRLASYFYDFLGKLLAISLLNFLEIFDVNFIKNLPMFPRNRKHVPAIVKFFQVKPWTLKRFFSKNFLTFTTDLSKVFANFFSFNKFFFFKESLYFFFSSLLNRKFFRQSFFWFVWKHSQIFRYFFFRLRYLVIFSKLKFLFFLKGVTINLNVFQRRSFLFILVLWFFFLTQFSKLFLKFHSKLHFFYNNWFFFKQKNLFFSTNFYNKLFFIIIRVFEPLLLFFR
jgi:hypothetical protein